MIRITHPTTSDIVLFKIEEVSSVTWIQSSEESVVVLRSDPNNIVIKDENMQILTAFLHDSEVLSMDAEWYSEFRNE